MRHLVLCCLVSGCAGFQAGAFVMALLAASRDQRHRERLAEAMSIRDSSDPRPRGDRTNSRLRT
jgi:hypothetical protein